MSSLKYESLVSLCSDAKVLSYVKNLGESVTSEELLRFWKSEMEPYVDGGNAEKGKKGAAKEGEKAEKVEKAAAKEAEKAEKAAAKEAEKAEKAAAKEAEKAEKAAEKEAQKCAQKAEKESAKSAQKAEKEAQKAEKKAAKEAEKGDKKSRRKKTDKKVEVSSTEDLFDALLNESNSAELEEEEEEEEVETKVTIVELDGVTYWKSEDNVLYNPETQDEMGVWDEESESIKKVLEEEVF
jgi:flagellar biosynthesis GTPase FlhF